MNPRTNNKSKFSVLFELVNIIVSLIYTLTFLSMNMAI